MELTYQALRELDWGQSKLIKLYHMWWLMSEIPVLRQLKQEDHHEFEVNLDNTVSSRSAWAMV